MGASGCEHSVTRVSPKLVVEDFDATLAFYTEVLKFEVGMKTPGYAIAQKGGATIHFSQAADASVLAAVRGHTEIYVEVENIDLFWQHVRNFKGSYHIRDLFDQPYGMTEFHIEDPNGCLVFVGQPTKAAQPRDQAVTF